ncbi:MAG: GIY-YIG nuclease family protein, partial [Patescibacteria group bacterium]
MNLLLKAKKFPLTPGIYMFLDGKRKVLYVGRAVSLRKRILNYFQKNLLDPRIKEMVSLARDIKYKKTENLLDAIVLEANLIKKYWPKYNIKDKDDRSFVYVAISKKDDFPKPIIVRGREVGKILSEPVNSQIRKNIGINKISVRKQMQIFGPYQSLHLIKNALKIIRKIFPYSTCKIGSGKPCFDYQIGLCPGACVGAISKKDYKKNIENIAQLLKGNKKRLLKKLKKENPNQAMALEHIQDVALLSGSEFENLKLKIENSAKRIEGYDVSHLAGKETYGSMVVFANGEADKSQYRLFKIKSAPANDDLRALEEIILRRFKHDEWQRPNLILIDGGRPQVSFISKTLRNKNINIPLVGISKYRRTRPEGVRLS